MQARRAARELSLILFSQFEDVVTKYSTADLKEIMLKSVRILTNSASEDLKLTFGVLDDMKQYIDDYETEHETNLQRPIDSSNLPVPLPLTSDLSGKIEELIDVSDKALFALEIAEFAMLEAQAEVDEYAIKIAESFKENYDQVDEIIKKFAKGWDFSRLVKVDKDILRIAIIELLYLKEVPLKVVVDEALELAKKYSTDDSSGFVNGVLAKVIYENGLK